jgi:hypothetical protein
VYRQPLRGAVAECAEGVEVSTAVTERWVVLALIRRRAL